MNFAIIFGFVVIITSSLAADEVKKRKAAGLPFVSKKKATSFARADRGSCPYTRKCYGDNSWLTECCTIGNYKYCTYEEQREFVDGCGFEKHRSKLCEVSYYEKGNGCGCQNAVGQVAECCPNGHIALQIPKCDTKASQPEQVHLSWHGDATEMWVTWVTPHLVKESVVEFGESRLTRSSNAIEHTFQNGGNEHRHIYIYRAHMTSLKPKTKYFYHVGSQAGWSKRFWFKTLPAGTDWSPRIAVYGDMGYDNNHGIIPLKKEAQDEHFDLVWHIGDMAYNLNDDNARRGDRFMRQIEPLAAYVPYQVASGNHEYAYNYSNYKNRFTMPKNGDGENMYYSYNVGPAHVVVYSSELYHDPSDSYIPVANQFRWLENDLKEAARAVNRKERPWIIVLAHHPMYCTTADADTCKQVKDVDRVGILSHGKLIYGIEQLFFKYGVDLHLAAHEHIYERLWPIYNYKVCNGTTSPSNPYDNPGAPVHITSGSAGCDEELDHSDRDPANWSAKRIDKYGYGHLKILNKTHIHWDQVSIKDFVKIVVEDEIMLIKREDNHGNYANNKVYKEKCHHN